MAEKTMLSNGEVSSQVDSAMEKWMEDWLVTNMRDLRLGLDQCIAGLTDVAKGLRVMQAHLDTIGDIITRQKEVPDGDD